MSSSDYARVIAQKYRLAISIAILNTKSEDLSIDEYLEQIKNVIIEKQFADGINKDDDLNISACTDDFTIDIAEELNDSNDLNKNLSHDPKNLLKHNLDNSNTDNEIALGDTQINDKNKQGYNNETSNDMETTINDVRTFNDNTQNIDSDKERDNYRIKLSNKESGNNDKPQGNDNKTLVNDNKPKGNGNKTGYNDFQGADHVVNGNAREFNTSKTILGIYEEAEAIDVNKERRDKFREVIQVLKGVNVAATDVVVVNESQRVLYDNLNKRFDPNDMDLTQCYDDNNTFFESINKLSNIDRRGNEQNCLKHNIERRQGNLQDTIYKRTHNESQQNVTNISLSQDNTKEKKIVNTMIIGHGQEPSCSPNTNEIKKIIKKRMLENEKNNASKPKIKKNIHDSINDNATETIEVINVITVNNNMNIANNNRLQAESNRDQSQNSTTIDTQETVYTVPEYTQYNTHYSQSQINDVDIDNRLIYGKRDAKNTELNALLNPPDQFHREIQNNRTIDKNNPNNDTGLVYSNINLNQAQANSVIENDTALLMDIQNKADDCENKCPNAQDMKNKTQDINNFDITTGNIGYTVLDKTDINNTDELNTDAEKVPFKIIEEMNRMTMYLKRNEFKESSGYKSSQSKCSFGSTQPQNIWIGESAHSVFNYLSNCSLIIATQELIEQISEVLGKVIDRLHEEETYPPFLEELLDTISKLLNHIYDENSYDFDVLLKKDEQIQRIILLNKSTHIQKYTIEKTNIILQNLLDDISAEGYEISNINRIENVCYIFHIIQIILSKYNISSQISTQSSQDERILRKKDISEVWRKKWIPNVKDTSIEGSLENKCVLKECSTILNKIIVNLMDKYSLIAFSALKCFNMMQS